MNIFALDNCPDQSAKWHVDKHVVKMVLEASQLLCTTFHLQNINNIPYKKTHQNHPSAIWTRASLDNFNWTLEYAKALAKEYTERYNKRHKCENTIEWVENSKNLLNLPNIGLTPFAMAMPDQYKDINPIKAYRKYYKYGKSELHSWKKNFPVWINDGSI